jgi:hypothetical protein
MAKTFARQINPTPKNEIAAAKCLFPSGHLCSLSTFLPALISLPLQQ